MLSVIIAPFCLSYSDCYYTGEFVVMLRFVLLNVVAPLTASLKKRKNGKNVKIIGLGKVRLG